MDLSPKEDSFIIFLYTIVINAERNRTPVLEFRKLIN